MASADGHGLFRLVGCCRTAWVLMPVTQILGLQSNLFYTALTAHGAALAFPFLFQLMVGVSLHRAGSCVGKPVTGPLPALIFWFMNIGAALLTVAILGGLKISYAVMYPAAHCRRPTRTVEHERGGARIYRHRPRPELDDLFYPVQVIRMLFFGNPREDLLLTPRKLNDPGMLGMAMAAFVLLVMGIPLMIVAGTVLLGLYGIFPMEAITWATEPVVFQFVFWIFAHNLMEAMAIMVISAVYATLPLYLRDGTRELFSNRLANLALWILLVTSVTSFFHHFYTAFPALPSALAYHGTS